MGAPRAPAHERFWRFVSPTEGCWEWRGAIDRKGYGRFGDGEKPVFAHRFSFRLHYGDFDPVLCVLHRCDNPPCVRPDHLFLGTQAQNISDMISKGRERTSETRARGSQIGASKITEDTAAAIVFMVNSAPRGPLGRLRKGTIAKIAGEVGVSAHIVAHISRGAWRHVR